MKITTAPKLFSLSIEAISKRIFDQLIDLESEILVKDLIKGFIVDACLPKSLLLRIVRLLIVFLDRGYNRYPALQAACQICNKDGWIIECTCELPDGDVNNLHRRQRAVLIIKAAIHSMTSRWGNKGILDPHHFLIDDGIAPRSLSIRGRQTVLIHMVESFISWCDITASGELQCCENCSNTNWPHTPNILNLRVEHGNWSGTRTALAAISSAIKGDTNHGMLKLNESACAKCGTTITKNAKLEKRRSRPVIKLDVVLMGSIQDWVIDVLLFVLCNSSSKGFDVEISSIRSEDVDLHKLRQVIESLAMPEKVQSLDLRMKNPKSIFSITNVLRKLTGLENFSFAHLWRRAEHVTTFTSEESTQLKNEILQNWTKLNKIRLEGIVIFSDFSPKIMHTNEENTELYNSNGDFSLPVTVQHLEFAYDSLSLNTLEWLANNCDKHDIEQSNSKQIHTIRIDSESLLSTSTKGFEIFLIILKKIRKSLRTLAIDHCGLSEETAKLITSVFTEVEEISERSNYPLEHFCFRENSMNSEASFSMFKNLCVAARCRILPRLAYFATMSPRSSDPFWRQKTLKTTTDKNPFSCLFELAMNEIAKAHFCSYMTCDVFWEPTDDDAM